MERREASGAAATAGDCFVRIFDAIGFGSILIGDQGKILRLGRLAEQHVGNGLIVRAGVLAATDAGSDQVLQQIIAGNLNGKVPKRDALGLRRIEMRPLILRVVPLPQDMSTIFDGAKLVAVLVDPDNCPEPPPGFLNQVFGLTRREALVATGLMCGDTLHQIADKAGVGIGTVRAQTKAALAKTGTKRQAELVGLLARLAVISYGAE